MGTTVVSLSVILDKKLLYSTLFYGQSRFLQKLRHIVFRFIQDTVLYIVYTVTFPLF